MNFNFYKYQALGNDFILLDGRKNSIYNKLTKSTIKQICNRKYGIGADGVLILKNSSHLYFELIYYNSDGSLSFCCNGTRCAVQYLYNENKQNNFILKAYDGIHKAILEDNLVKLEMHIGKIKNDGEFFIDTGAPHIIKFVEDITKIDVLKVSKRIKEKLTNPSNITFVSLSDKSRTENGLIFATTFEKGVEEETLACGTGAVAAAIASNLKHNIPSPIKVKMKGGELIVEFNKNERNNYKEVYIKGDANKVFEGICDSIINE
ncbi:MAG: diaminopimelate epimerase [Bacteroidetes bacterium]|nr:diaminopimelate epimerase [Bacteroidota bacterium]